MASSGTKAVIQTPIQLYKHLMRTVKRLPAPTQDYYRNHVRQNYKSHNDETDSERIQQIIARAVDDAEWVVKKYTKSP